MWSKIEQYIHVICKAFALVSVVFLFIMMMFIAVDVVGRYLFNKPIPGSIDFVTVMMVLLVFPAFGYLTSQDGHVRTDILFESLKTRWKGIFDIVNSLFSLLLIVCITWQLGLRAWTIIKNPPGISTSYFQWPHLPFIILAAIGMGLMALEMFIWLFHSINKARGAEK
ncbi:MAG TPA: TRAP transporter small permease [Syntrophorhabdaceae bacterium]|nr:TRAP transporter small permease [Syntrophorhabdaceae bacterium]